MQSFDVLEERRRGGGVQIRTKHRLGTLWSLTIREQGVYRKRVWCSLWWNQTIMLFYTNNYKELFLFILRPAPNH